MPEGQRHLTHGERCRIGALKESGLSDGAVAARPGRDRPVGLAGAAPERRGFGIQPGCGAGESGGAPQRGIQGPLQDDGGALGERQGVSGEGGARPEPGRTRPAPAAALRCPESADRLSREGTPAVPGPESPAPGGRKSRLPLGGPVM